MSIFLILFSSFVLSLEECAPKGDVNGDGFLNVDDRELLKQILIGESPKVECADVNGDAEINKEDYELQYQLIISSPDYQGPISVILREREIQNYQGNTIKIESISYQEDQDHSIVVISVNDVKIPIKVYNELYNYVPAPASMPRIYEQGLLIMVIEFNENEVHVSISEREEPEITKRKTTFKLRPIRFLQVAYISELDNRKVNLKFYVDIDSQKLSLHNLDNNEKEEFSLVKEVADLSKILYGEVGYYKEVLKGSFRVNNILHEVYIDIRDYFDDPYGTPVMIVTDGQTASMLSLLPYGCDIKSTLKYPEEEGVVAKYALEQTNVVKKYILEINSIDDKGVSFIVNGEKTPILNEKKNYYQLSTNEYFMLMYIERRGSIYYPMFCLDEEDELNLIPLIHNRENILTEQETQESICEGCLDFEECIQYNEIKNYKYCDFETKQLQPQKRERQQCLEDFQCFSGFCRQNRCITPGVWNKFIAWFSKFFG